jgi:hypothetical protein
MAAKAAALLAARAAAAPAAPASAAAAPKDIKAAERAPAGVRPAQCVGKHNKKVRRRRCPPCSPGTFGACVAFDFFFGVQTGQGAG